MNKGDIIIAYKDDVNAGIPIIAYDKNIGITTSLFEKNIVNIEKYLNDNKFNYIVIRPVIDTSWQKRKKLNDYLTRLVVGDISLTFRQRLHFLDYVLWLYEELLDIKVLDNPVMPTINNLIKSDKIALK